MTTAHRSKPLRVAGLFAGIGGLEEGLKRAGHETIFLSEIHEGAQAVLRARFPGVPLQSDVRTIERLPKGTQLLAAGFPCQDLSQAGGTRGIRGKKSGLVHHLFRLLDQKPVKWVLIENVPFMLSLGRGSAMRYLTKELEARGYKWAYRVVNTLAFGIPQRRERVFLLASRSSDPARVLFRDSEDPVLASEETAGAFGFYWTEGRRGLGWAVEGVPTLKGGSTVGIPSPPAIWLPGRGFCTPDIRDAERLQGFSPGWTLEADRNNGTRRSSRWLLVGNAVTVDVAEWVGGVFRQSPGELPHQTSALARQKSWPKAGFGKPGTPPRVVDVSTWPVVRPYRVLSQFLEYETIPLSKKAASGFLSRYQGGSLRKRPALVQALTQYVSLAPAARATRRRQRRRVVGINADVE